MVKEEYLAWLEREYPDLVPRYLQMYANRAYAKPGERETVSKRVSALIRDAGGLRTIGDTHPRYHRRRPMGPPPGKPGTASEPPEQLSILG